MSDQRIMANQVIILAMLEYLFEREIHRNKAKTSRRSNRGKWLRKCKNARKSTVDEIVEYWGGEADDG